MAKIVVVDDEESLRELLEAILAELGHEVFSAANGEQALKLVEQMHPSLVISDVMMPVMNGYLLLEQIRLKPEWRSVKVILISAAYVKLESYHKADAYIAKPYDLATLEALIEQLVSQ